ncbi:unnamed protein product [Cylicostephanus goldi]|uniref:3'-phosphate/5'-hydroxy nucleic acid ligase n=1 Tax=Cylicostephanus goldi TaxID=71465 RepID=A0A3P6UNR2_CYLGO|nr:unnamed protein product [Cylicostephanus goldi]
MSAADLVDCLEMGMDWTLREGYSWAEDKEHCEEYGRMLQADATKVSTRAKKRGLPQLGTLGAGNHYAEVQVIDEIYDKHAAAKMGIAEKGQVVVMLHCGSRGLGHQVATDALVEMEKAMARDGISVNDRQLACARLYSNEGQDYLKGMAAAANFAWVNRSCMTFCVRQAFANTFNIQPDDLDMQVCNFLLYKLFVFPLRFFFVLLLIIVHMCSRKNLRKYKLACKNKSEVVAAAMPLFQKFLAHRLTEE